VLLAPAGPTRGPRGQVEVLGVTLSSFSPDVQLHRSNPAVSLTLRWGTLAETAWEQAADNRGKQKMLTTIRSTTNTKNKFLRHLGIVLLCVGNMWLCGCAGLVSSANPKTGGNSTLLTISNAAATSATMNSIQVGWTTSAPATSQVNYGKTASYGSSTGVNSTMVSAHQTGIVSLTPGTTYHFQISSTDANGNSATSSDMTFTTLTDTTPPTVAIVTPAAGATISGTAVIISATASDNVAIAGVQFKVDGTSIGSPVTAAPYTYRLDTTTLSNANHTLTAVATDTSGNSATSAAVTVAVNNTTKDTTPPTVSITAPANGATVSNTVTVSANATDNVAVASVQFQLDNANVGTADLVAPYAYSWDSTKSTNGTHTLRAIATDTSNNSTTSASVTVTVSNSTKDTTPPTVTMTAPANGATVSKTVTVSANATDNVAVASVQFQVDNANVGAADTVAPYTYSWDTTKSTNGTHTVRATAIDTSNNSATSTSVTVTVSNAADTTPPTVPAALTATAISSSQINLSWTASTDNVGVTGYKVYRGGAQIGTDPSTSYSDTSLAASTSYTYNVAAYDAAGNTSAQSAGASATTLSSSGGGGIPSALGWYQIPNTQLQTVCPNATTYNLAGSCAGEMYAWSGATADTTGNRLLIWGGGHVDWYGNEVYALNLTANPISLTRLDNPTSFASHPQGACGSGAYWDGNPCARHTYSGMAYVPGTNSLINFAGGRTPDGSSLINNNETDIWSLNAANVTWTQEGIVGPVSQTTIGMSAYDPNSGLVFMHDGSTLFAYNPTTNSFTNVDTSQDGIRNGLAYSSLVVDPVHKYVFVMGGSGGGNTGGNLYRWNISGSAPYTRTDLLASSTGCSAYLGTTTTNTAPGGPGVVWYPTQNKIVMWNGGASVALYDPVSNSCSIQTPAGAAPACTDTFCSGGQQEHGTFGRFSYFPQLGVFALCNSVFDNCYTLRLDSAGGTGGSPGPTISAVGASSITASTATISWTTDVTATSQVEYGTTTAYGTSTSLNSSLVTMHSVQLTGLAASTMYNYQVNSNNSTGVGSNSGNFTFQTNSTIDTTPPTVSITSPAANATVSGTVTLTASASDNVGVSTVQFQLDGGSLGPALTLSPYSMSWDTTTTTNGVHILTAQASDAAGNVGTSAGVSVTVSNSASSADQNFQQRCAAPGVLNCQGFDTITTATQCSDANLTDGFCGQGNQANNNLDTSVYLSGGGSQRWTWPTNDNTDNCCQDYHAYFGQGSKNVSFGQNSDFYVQYAFRADAAWTTVGWETDGSYPKLFIAHSSSVGSCSQLSLVAVNFRTYNVPQMYTNCSGNVLDTCSDGTTFTSGCSASDIYSQQGWVVSEPFTGYQCAYGNGVPQHWIGPNCLNLAANTWYTMYFHVHVGTWGAANSVVEAWIAPYGQQLKKWINTSEVVITSDGSAGYNEIDLTQYMTSHSTSEGGSGVNPTVNVWFDELIISSQPIPAPAGQTP
jgi:chitodextrinase